MQTTLALAEKFMRLITGGDAQRLIIDEFFLHETINRNFKFIPRQLNLRLSLLLPRIYSYDFGYHNLTHAYEVAKLASAYSKKLCAQEHVAFLAGIFHDAWRDVNITRDTDQVKHTVSMLKDELNHEVYSFMSEEEKSQVLAAIACTAFDGLEFPIEPQDTISSLIRDMDLSMFISDQWPYMFSGLMLEMKRNPESMDDIRVFANQQLAFFAKHPLFLTKTPLGVLRDNYIKLLSPNVAAL